MRAFFLITVLAAVSCNAFQLEGILPWNSGSSMSSSGMSLNLHRNKMMMKTMGRFQTQELVSSCPASSNQCDATSNRDKCSHGGQCYPKTTASLGSCALSSPYSIQACGAPCNLMNFDQCPIGTSCRGGSCTTKHYYGCSCTANEQCDSNNCTSNVCVPHFSEKMQYAWPCRGNTDCYSGVCSNGKCGFTADGGACKSNFPTCASGSYCKLSGGGSESSGTCTPRLPVGAICSSSNECIQWANNLPVICDLGNSSGLCSNILKPAGSSCISSGVCAFGFRCNPQTFKCESKPANLACDSIYGAKYCQFGGKCVCDGSNVVCRDAATQECLTATIDLYKCWHDHPGASLVSLGPFGPSYNPLSGSQCGQALASVICSCDSLELNTAMYSQLISCSNGTGTVKPVGCPIACSAALPTVQLHFSALFVLAVSLLVSLLL